MTVLAIDLGGTKVATALITPDGDVLERGHALLGGRGGRDVVTLIADQCRSLQASARNGSLPPPIACGVTVPGIYRANSGTVWAPNIPGWDDYPLLDELQSAFGPSIRVVIDSDRAAYILGETWRGSAAGARNAIFLAVGTGIGAGILADGRVLRGSADIAGAIGWLALDRPFDPRYVSCGHFEYHASGPGIAAVAKDLLASDPNYDGELRRTLPNELTAGHVLAAHERGDPIARRVVSDAIAFWGMAAANLVSLFNPETIIFGGGVFGPATRFLEEIRAEATKWAQPISMRQVRFVASTLGGDAGIIGAARLALEPVAQAAASPVGVASR